MVFSRESYDAVTLRQYLHASNALSYDTLESSLHQAWSCFLMPVLGASLCEHLTRIAESASLSEVERTVLSLARNAVANLAMWYDFEELNVRLTDQGHQRQETENFKSLYKYQKDALRNGYKNKGFNALDALIATIGNHADVFTEWTGCPANVARMKSIVRSPDEVNNVVFINRSSLIFLRLQPILRKIEQTQVVVMLGQKLYEDFMKKLDDSDAVLGTTTVEELRIRVGRVMVNKAVAELIRQTGSLTDRGLYFDTMVAGREGNEASSPVNMDEAVKHAAVFEQDAHEQLQALQNFIAYHIPDLFAGRPEDVFKRNNDHKRTVWL